MGYIEGWSENTLLWSMKEEMFENINLKKVICFTPSDMYLVKSDYTVERLLMGCTQEKSDYTEGLLASKLMKKLKN